MVDEKRALFAMSIVLDGGQCVRHRPAAEHSHWYDWDNNTSALVAQFEASSSGL
jgi:hypothetical protein